MAQKLTKSRRSTMLWGKRYARFKQYYRTQRKLIHRRGFETYIEREGEKILTKTEFKEQYIALMNDRKKEIESGQRKTVGNIEKALSSMQAYELSESKAYAILDFLKKYRDEDEIEYSAKNINELLMKIRTGSWIREDVGLWDKIKRYREDLFASGMSKADVRAEVSITVFGSDPKKYGRA